MASLIILECLLVIITVFGFFLNNKKFLSPSFIFGTFFVVSCTIAIIGNAVFWKEEIHPLVVFVISFSLLLFNFGEYFSKKLFDYLKTKDKKVPKLLVGKIDDSSNPSAQKIFISWPLVIVVLIILLISLTSVFLEYYFDIKMLTELGRSTNFNTLVFQLRAAIFEGHKIPSIVSNFSMICFFIGLIFVFLFFYVYFNSKKPVEALLFVPQLIPTFAIAFLSTARLNYAFIIIFAIASILVNIRIAKYKSYKPLVIVVFINIALIFVLAFVLIGINRRQINNGMQIFEVILTYGGSPIIAFNKAIANIKDPSIPFGSASFSGFYYLVNKIAPNTTAEFAFDEHVIFNNGTSTNVYPIFRAWTYDFGLPTCYIFSFIFGLFNGFVYQRLVNKNNALCFESLYYCYLVYCLVLSVVSKLGTSTLFTWRRIAMLIVFGLFVLILRTKVVQKYILKSTQEATN